VSSPGNSPTGTEGVLVHEDKERGFAISYPAHAKVENVEGGVQFSSPSEGWRYGVLVSSAEGRSLDAVADDLVKFLEDTLGYENVEMDDGIQDVSSRPAIMISYGDGEAWHTSIFLIGQNGMVYELQTESNMAVVSNSKIDTDVYSAMTGSFRLL
jgi:hypothetical protein